MLYFVDTLLLSKNADCWRLVHMADFYQMPALQRACWNSIITALHPGCYVQAVLLFNRLGAGRGADDVLVFGALKAFGKSNFDELRNLNALQNAIETVLISRSITLACGKVPKSPIYRQHNVSASLHKSHLAVERACSRYR